MPADAGASCPSTNDAPPVRQGPTGRGTCPHMPAQTHTRTTRARTRATGHCRHPVAGVDAPEATLVLMHAVELPFERMLRLAGVAEVTVVRYRDAARRGAATATAWARRSSTAAPIASRCRSPRRGTFAAASGPWPGPATCGVRTPGCIHSTPRAQHSRPSRCPRFGRTGARAACASPGWVIPGAGCAGGCGVGARSVFPPPTSLPRRSAPQ